MNQILYTTLLYKKKKEFFIVQLVISILLIILFIIYVIYFLYNIYYGEKTSDKLLTAFDMSSLYSTSDDYITVKLNTKSISSIIGVIEIDKINLKYTIFTEINNDLLKIAPCRFYGPMPNKIGNLCIAAHNYNNEKLFSRINELSTNDIIKIYDSSGFYIDYYIYDKFETPESNTLCTSQDTNGFREITLVTCNNLNKNRIIIKAKEKL